MCGKRYSYDDMFKLLINEINGITYPIGSSIYGMLD